jgi:hypothetical protein
MYSMYNFVYIPIITLEEEERLVRLAKGYIISRVITLTSISWELVIVSKGIGLRTLTLKVVCKFRGFTFIRVVELIPTTSFICVVASTSTLAPNNEPFVHHLKVARTVCQILEWTPNSDTVVLGIRSACLLIASTRRNTHRHVVPIDKTNIIKILVPNPIKPKLCKTGRGCTS